VKVDMLGKIKKETAAVNFSDIKGQPDAVDLMKTIVRAEENYSDNENIAVLFAGPSGSGKTLFAKVLHNGLGNSELVIINGQCLTLEEVYRLFLDRDENDTRITIFIDEVHGLDKRIQNILLTVLSEGVINTPNCGSEPPYSIPVLPFTLILATTHEYKIIEALRNRMAMIIKLSFYDINTLSEIILDNVNKQGYRFEDDSLACQIAARSKNIPRLAVDRIAAMAMKVAAAEKTNLITEFELKQAFKLLKIDNLGLDIDERLYLEYLAKHRRLKRNMLASMTGLPAQTISEVIEPFLVRAGLIHKDGSERIISDKGLKHIQIFYI
jgi:Holliday junction DNA helicase RuvB